MMRIAFLSVLLVVSVSSTSLIRKSLVRRQTEPEPCQAIEGFDCKCSYYRVTCTTERDLQSAVTILPQEREKYQSVELVITGERDYNVYDSTFEPVKQLYKPDADNLEFRVKFEKFTGLHLQSPGIFNRVFPDNLPANARKHLALEIYNPNSQPHDNPALFQNLNVDSLELYVLYPFRGSFQQLFNGANIKYLRLSGGDITSDLSKPFSGNVARLELAKQASSLSIQNFPVYPAHELIINAYYVSEFNSEHPPNYSNLGELRIHSQERIPANAFQQFPNIHTLSVSTEQDIDPQAFNGLNNLEKLTIKDSKPNLDILNRMSHLKEFESHVEKLDENSQCQLIEKLANGQVAVQAIPNGRECTCVAAYLDTASGRYPCQAQNCEQSSCPAIRNNFDATTRTFKAPPAILRADGSDALRPREARLYTAPFQVSEYDQQKFQNAVPQSGSSANDGQQENQAGQSNQDGSEQPYNPHNNQQPAENNQDKDNDGDGDSEASSNNDENQKDTDSDKKDNESGGEANQNQSSGGAGDENKQGESGQNQGTADGDGSSDQTTGLKKKTNWLPIILIVAAMVGLIVALVIFLIIRKRRNNPAYNQTPTSEQAAAAAAAKA